MEGKEETDNPIPTTAEQAVEPPPLVSPFVRKPLPYQLFALFFWAYLWIYLGQSTQSVPDEKLERLYYPAETALWFAGRQMFLAHGLNELGDSKSQHVAYATQALSEAITVLEARPDSGWKVNCLRANLIILLAECGELNTVRSEMRRMPQDLRTKLFKLQFNRIYESKFEVLTSGRKPDLEWLGDTWMKWRFEEKLNNSLLRETDAKILSDRTNSEAEKAARIESYSTGFLWALFLLGLVSAYFAGKRVQWTLLSQESELPPWAGMDGLTLFLMVNVFGMFLFWILSYTFNNNSAVYFNFALVYGLPLLGLLLWRYGSAGIKRFINLREGLAELPKLAAKGFKAFPVAWLALALFTILLGWLGLDSHWTEGWTEAEVFAHGWDRLSPMLGMAIWGPLFEEMLWRGLLYASLRKWVGVMPAALVSSVIFGWCIFTVWRGFYP